MIVKPGKPRRGKAAETRFLTVLEPVKAGDRVGAVRREGADLVIELTSGVKRVAAAESSVFREVRLSAVTRCARRTRHAPAQPADRPRAPERR